MAYDFNANEVFEMAIRIEENGAAFYRKAAELQSDESNQDFLRKLAAMEDAHKVSFNEMQKNGYVKIIALPVWQIFLKMLSCI